MELEYLFHGKRVGSREWVEGYYVHLYDGRGNESHRIYTGYAETDCGEFYPIWYEVDPSTIGQYTGLTDKNGVKIFRGGILASRYDRDRPEDVAIEVVTWAENGWCIKAQEDEPFHLYESGTLPLSEIVGNIHDNPELLEEAGHE